MSSLEKRAWFQLGVVIATATAWCVLFAFFHSVAVSMAAFSLLALTALPASNQVRAFADERDRAIAESSLALGLRCWLVLSTLVPVGAGLLCGWEQPVTIGVVVQAGWVGWCVLLLARSVAAIYMYHEQGSAAALRTR